MPLRLTSTSMTDFRSISGLGQIADDYDVLLCDIWGVVHNGRMAFGEACEALERFRGDRGPVILLTNSPKPSRAIPEQLQQVGVIGEIFDAIVTSGDATVDEIARRAPGPVYKLGPDRDDSLYDGLELNFSDLDEAAFISCTGLFDDETETPEDYRDMLGHAFESGIPMVCANPDIKVQRGEKEIYCGGALAQLYERLGGEVIYSGKPHEPIYRLSRAWLAELLGEVPAPDRILAIGDNIFTDLLGAQNQDVDCLFISGGIHGRKKDQLTTLLMEHNITARYMASSLNW